VLGGQELLIVFIVIALIFGASRLPLLGRNLGQGIKEFKAGIGEFRDKDKDDSGKDQDEGGTGKTAGGGPATSQNGTGASDDIAAKRRD
jgi:sec-independent protein translocase protein TatA